MSQSRQSRSANPHTHRQYKSALLPQGHSASLSPQHNAASAALSARMYIPTSSAPVLIPAITLPRLPRNSEAVIYANTGAASGIRPSFCLFWFSLFMPYSSRSHRWYIFGPTPCSKHHSLTRLPLFRQPSICFFHVSSRASCQAALIAI